ALLDDARSGWRVVRRSPGLAVVAVTALAMGIGFTTTMFGIVHGATRALPIAESDELVAFTENVPSTGASDLGSRPFAYRQWAGTLTSYDGLGAFQTVSLDISRDSQTPERLEAAFVTPNTFALLQIAAAQGRFFTERDAEPGAPDVILISHALWHGRFGGDREILGRVIHLDGRPRSIVGVMPPRFGFPINARVWLPLRVSQSAGIADDGDVRVFGRLRDS